MISTSCRVRGRGGRAHHTRLHVVDVRKYFLKLIFLIIHMQISLRWIVMLSLLGEGFRMYRSLFDIIVF